MAEGNFNLSNLNVVASQIASGIFEDEPKQQSEEGVFSRVDDSVEVTSNALYNVFEEKRDISNSYCTTGKDMNYDPMLDEKLKSQQFVKPTFREHPTPTDDSNHMPYKEINLSNNYWDNISSTKFIINPYSSSSDEEDSVVADKKSTVQNHETVNPEVTDEPEDGADQEHAPAQTCVVYDNNLAPNESSDNREIPNGTFNQNSYPDFVDSMENKQPMPSACTGYYFESGTTCYVYQPVQNLNTESFGNQIYYQMPCYNAANYIDGSYQYVSHGYPDVVTENTDNTTNNYNSCEPYQTENHPNTPSVDSRSYLLEGSENEENGVKTIDEDHKSTSCEKVIDLSKQQHNDSCHFPQYSESNEAARCNPNYQALSVQQPLLVADNCHPFTISEGTNTNFQYPAMYISQNGLVTILLKCDISVEMTLDRAIRLVSHQKNLVVASSAMGDSNFLIHSAGIISHKSSVVEADIYLKRRIKMAEEDIIFGNSDKSYKFNDNKIDVEATPDFAKLSKNSSVSILFTSNKSSNKDLVQSCMEVVACAQYHPLRHISGGYVIHINDMKVIQNGKGDVKVVCPDKLLRLSPTREDVLLRSKNIEMGIESDWSMWINHGKNFMRANKFDLILCNGSIEAGFDTNDRVRACRIPTGIPVHIGEESFLPKRRYVPRARQKSRKEFD